MNNTAILLMNYIYNPDGFDWMNFQVSKSNPYTYHHIVEKRNGGKKTIENGAILTRDAHDLLNTFERYCPDEYDELQEVFKRINASGEPPTPEIMMEIDLIIYKGLFTNQSNYIKRKTLYKYRMEYLKSRKLLRKTLQ